MAQIVEIEGGDENVSAFLEPYIQSGSLNFLIGSGASFPAIKIAGNVESEINALLTAGDHNAANRKSLDFIEAINTVHAKINKPPLVDRS
jgi:hypothetical protein